MTDHVQYRHAHRNDLKAIADIFIAAFPESVHHYVGHSFPPDALIDVFSICIDAEGDAFFVAVIDNDIAGYIFAPAHFSKVVKTAIWQGHIFRLLWHWISGKYGIGFGPISIVSRNWLTFLRESQEKALYSDARILSVAVNPSYHGHGLGTGLVRRGLEYLQAKGVKTVRLEVRPDNKVAIHIYEKFGFETRGTTRDTQGTWLIMLKDMA